MDLSNYTEPKPKHFKRIIWFIINRTIFYCLPGLPLRYLRNLILRAFGAKIPLDCLIYSSCKIWAPWNLQMARNSTVGPNTELYNKAAIVIGDNSVISQGSKLYTASHEISDPNHALIMFPINIGNKAWIAADAFIGPGVTVGEGAVVGARGVVFKDVEPWTVVAGNPAKFIKKREIKS